MIELNTHEIEQISGAGFFGNVGTLIGSAIGTGIDTVSVIAGVNPDAKTTVGTLGKGVGLIADSAISTALQLITKI